MSTTLTVYGGVQEVGGNKILLEDGEHRIFFDFGKSFGNYGQYFDGVFIKDRVGRGLLDPLALHLLPPLRGLLRQDLVPAFSAEDLLVTEIPPEGRRKSRLVIELLPRAIEAFWDHWRSHFPAWFRDLRRPDAPAADLVLLSHAHQDHISDLEYVSPEVPACGTRMTAFISKVLLDTGMATSGAPYVSPRAPKEDGVLASVRNEPLTARPWLFLEPEPEGEVSDDPLATPRAFWEYGGSKGLSPRPQVQPPGLPIRHWGLDHSLFGAAGYAVETQAGWVAYTGDLRFHGQDGEKSWAFADGLAELGVVALLCEGTRLTQPNETTEAMVHDNCLREVRDAAGKLVLADFAPRNVERLRTFLSIAEDTGRRLLMQPKDAYLLRAMALADPSLPELMLHPHAGMYADPKVSQFKWERCVRERYTGRTLSPLEVKASPGEVILAFSLTDMADMIDLVYLMGGQPGGLYLFSNSKAYDEEQMVDLVRLWNWTQHLGLKIVGLQPTQRGPGGRVMGVDPVPGYHASGHAGMHELEAFVRRVSPQKLIAIHTEMPERWLELLQGTGIDVVLPEYGLSLDL